MARIDGTKLLFDSELANMGFASTFGPSNGSLSTPTPVTVHTGFANMVASR